MVEEDKERRAGERGQSEETKVKSMPVDSVYVCYIKYIFVYCMSVIKERCFIGFQFPVILCNNHIHQEEESEGYESEGLEGDG